MNSFTAQTSEAEIINDMPIYPCSDGISNTEHSEPMTRMLSLKEIASWQFPELAGNLPAEHPALIAGTPSLQRGSVWNAGQLEMLWDSLFRGFPIGALVVSPKNLAHNQKIHAGRYFQESGGSSEFVDHHHFTHHLLDGQQRCNAIALGFLDPTEERHLDSPAVLWLDLNKPLSSDKSTRMFWFKVLTRAHPWGYCCDDKATRLSREKFRAAMSEWRIPEGQKRPIPTKVWPPASSYIEPSAPIPLQWLMQAVACEGKRGQNLWTYLSGRCELIQQPWAQRTVEFIKSYPEELDRIESAAAYAAKTNIVALVWAGVPGQNGTKSDSKSSLLNVEQLFQRLNTQGTPLQGAELLYSMVKAHWPGMEDVMASFENFEKSSGRSKSIRKPVDDARLAMLGFRAARIGLDKTAQGQNRYPAEPSIAAIRGWANPGGTDKQLKEKEDIENYLGLHSSPARSDFHENVAIIDDWLLWKHKGDFGIPPVLRSEIARNAPEVYLMLLDIAQRMRNEGYTLDVEGLKEWRQGLIGLVSSVFWFSEKREPAVQKIGAYLSERTLNPACFKGALLAAVDDKQSTLLQTILTPPELEEAVPRAPLIKEDLATWDLYKRMVSIVEVEDKERSHREHIWNFFWRLVKTKSFLHFAQRDLMGAEFGDYDPAQTDTWAEHDRPWDVDHILAQSIGSYRTDNLRAACYVWLDTLGNWRNCALEKNRSKGGGMVNKTIFEKEDLELSLIADANAFNLDNDDLCKEEKVAGFANEARARFQRMYKDWYDQLQIQNLFQKPVLDDAKEDGEDYTQS